MKTHYLIIDLFLLKDEREYQKKGEAKTPPLSLAAVPYCLSSTYFQHFLKAIAVAHIITRKRRSVVDGPTFRESALKPTAGSNISLTPAFNVSLVAM